MYRFSEHYKNMEQVLDSYYKKMFNSQSKLDEDKIILNEKSKKERKRDAKLLYKKSKKNKNSSIKNKKNNTSKKNMQKRIVNVL